MKITERQLRNLIRKTLLIEQPGQEERVVFDPKDVKMPMNRRVKKFLDPEVTPIKKQKFDAEIDDAGTIQQQAQALAAKALTYADKAPKDSLKLMNMSRSMLQRMIKSAGGSPGDTGGMGGSLSTELIDYLVTNQKKDK